MARSAALRSKGASQGQLRLEQARAAAEARRDRPASPPTPAAPPAEPEPEPIVRSVYAEEPTTPFGAWLVKQKGNRNEAIDALAKAAAADPRFPKAGDPDAVRKHIGAKGADPEMFEAIDDAESAWLRD